ncbi:MAG: gliding motility lipoprotein GldH [Prevotella sp.]|nr:gliding motility lipoprotein GldH [Prevotella sp.]
MNRLLCILAVALAIAGCNRNTVYSHYEHTPIEGWGCSDTVCFCVTDIPQSDTYAEELGLRISTAFPYTALTFIVSQQAKASALDRIDTLTASLTDDEGNLNGKGGIDHHQYTFPLSNVHLEQGDTLRIAVTHCMRRETLPGISDLGIVITKP